MTDLFIVKLKYILYLASIDYLSLLVYVMYKDQIYSLK